MGKNEHFFNHPKIIIPSLSHEIRDDQYPSWWDTALVNARSLLQFLGLQM